MTDPKTLAADPEWFPDALDATAGAIRFGRMSREALSKEAFLDRRKDASVTQWAEAKIDDLLPHIAKAPAPAFIYHSAFCGSTLLARALDAPGKSLALKEPNILLDLVNARRVTPALQSGDQFNQLAAVVLGLLARPHEEGERILIKPTNSASPLAAYTNSKNAPAIFLYGSLRDFLISLLKKGEEGRVFVRHQFNIFSLDRTPLSAIQARQAISLTDMQIAALVWRHQLEEFARMIKPAGYAASLDYARLIDNSEPVLAAAARHLSLPLDADDVKAAANGPVFQTNSKFADQQFDAGVRQSENAAVETQFAKELDIIENWAKAVKLSQDLTLPLPRSLAA